MNAQLKPQDLSAAMSVIHAAYQHPDAAAPESKDLANEVFLALPAQYQIIVGCAYALPGPVREVAVHQMPKDVAARANKLWDRFESNPVHRAALRRLIARADGDELMAMSRAVDKTNAVVKLNATVKAPSPKNSLKRNGMTNT